MRKIVFDTDVLIEFIRGNERVKANINDLLGKSVLAYTPVTVAELYRGLKSNERARTESTLSSFDCLNLTHDVGKKAGDYLKSYAPSHGLEFPDAMIAACAFIHQFALCTFNWKHYPMREVQRYQMER